MITFMRWASSLVLVGAIVIPAGLVAQEHDRDRDHDRGRIYDRDHRDYHSWNSNEDRAYHRWYNENHNGREYREYNRMKSKDQRAYWNWRHNHPDNDHDRDDRH